MLEKMFTTKMSMDKKKLQNRFSKIRSKNGKTSKFIAMAVFAIIIVSIVCVSIWVAVNRQQNDIADNADVKLTLNGVIINFDNEPYVLSETRSTGGYSRQVMAYFPLEELTKKVDYLSSIENDGNKIVINLPNANDIYTIEIDRKEIEYRGKNNEINSMATRTTYYAPEMKNNLVYIPYEFIEYLWIDANNYDIFGSTLYKNEELNVQFEIPMYWLGKYFVDERQVDEEYIIFKHKAIADKYDGSGTLFTLRKKLDKEFDALVNTIENQTIVWQNEEYGYIVGRPTDVQHPIWADRDKEDINFADEYERMTKEITYIEETFSLINDVDTPVITNAENMSFAQMKDLQRQVDNGHFPWRLDYEQVMQSYISGKGYTVEDGSLMSFAGDGEKCSGVYGIGNYRHHIELFKPIDKTEHGIWVVRSYKIVEPVEIKEVVFHNLTKKDNKAVAERVLQQSDGWYNLLREASAYINFNGVIPQSVVAKFTPAGTEMQEFEKEVGRAIAPFEQIPILINMNFSKEDTMGHLQFEFNYEDGSMIKSELFNVLVEH